MSWQKHSIQLILGFPLALPIVTYAVNIGDTYVQSGQNQPLNATINVTDIDPKSFSVQVATPEMYSQLGLTADQQVKAKFIPTSNNGGKIVLTTKRPVANPFTDVVLNIQNKGEKKLLPKTLLMPLGNKAITTQPPAQTVDILPETVVVTQNQAIDLPKTTAPASVEVPAEIPVTPPQKTNTKATIALPTANTVKNPSSAQFANTDGTLDMPAIDSTTATNTAKNNPNATTTQASSTASPDSKHRNKPNQGTTTDQAEKPIATTTYVVQRNDNLWTIANRIAVKNHTSPKKVMQDIMDANPAAFETGDATSLEAHTALKIPKYKVMPSSSGIKSAKTIRNHSKTSLHKNASKQKTTVTHKAKPKATSRRALRRAKYHATARPARSTRKSEMTIVAPTHASGASQGASQIQNNSVSRYTAPQLIEEVKQKRQNAAGQASKVSQLNSSLENSAQRLKLQNEKLAMLEKRLKELNGK